MSDCGHDHSKDDPKDSHRRAAELIVASSKLDRAELNARAAAVVAEAKETWPSVSDEDLISILRSQGMLVERFSRMDVLTLSSVFDAVFSNCVLAAASLAGAYDLGEVDTPKRDLDEIIDEAVAAEKGPEDDEYFGVYL